MGDDKIKVKLEPRKFGRKKSPLNFNEIEYIVEQLNKNERKFDRNIKIKSLYKYPELYPYSSFIVSDEVEPSLFYIRSNIICNNLQLKRYTGLPLFNNLLKILSVPRID